MSPVLEVAHLTVRLGGRPVLDDLSFSLADRGRVVGLFGQNGAGKTTLIRTVCGVINVFDGRVTPRGPAVGYLPDEPHLYRDLPLRTLVALCARVFGDVDTALASRMLAELGLDEGLRIREASRGMTEQIHLALTLARRCGLYVLDEPLAAVDPLTRDRLLDMVRRHRAPGSTVLVSTHLIAGLEELFDEVVVLHDGRLVLQDEVSDLAAAGGLERRFKEVVSAAAR